MSDSVADLEAGDEDAGPVTIYDIQGPDENKVRFRALPRLTRQAIHIAWASGRSEFVVATLLQVIAGGGIALLLLLGQQGLQALLELQSGNRSRQLRLGQLRSLGLLEFSHLSQQSNANVKKSSAK